MDENNPFVKNKITLNLNCVEGVDTEKLNKKILPDYFIAVKIAMGKISNYNVVCFTKNGIQCYNKHINGNTLLFLAWCFLPVSGFQI